MSKNKLNIIYLATHGFAVRMLMQTNLLSRLKDAGYEVGIITTDSKDPSVSRYCEEHSIENIGFKQKQKRLQYYIEFFRKYFLEDVKKNPALYEKHLRLRDASAKSFSARWKYYAGNIIYSLVKAFPFIRYGFRKLENKYLNSDVADSIINKYNPDLVISTVPVNLAEAQLLHSAGKKNIKTVTHILSWDNITCKGHFRKVTDEFIVWGEIMKNELIRYYKIDPSKIHETGVPHFDIHFQNRISNEGKPVSNPYLFFAMSSPYFAPREIDIVEKIAKWVDDNTWPGLNFVVRPHPQNVIGYLADLNWLPRLKNVESNRVTVNYPDLNEDSGINWSMKQDDMNSMSKLIGGSAIVLNSCSTMTIDGLCCGKPIIITAFDNEEKLPWHISVKRVMEYEHFRNIIESGAVKAPSNYDELKDSISQYFFHPETDEAKRENILYREVGKGDGKATDRVIAALMEISGSKNKTTTQSFTVTQNTGVEG